MANNPLQFNILMQGCPESQPSVKHFFFFFIANSLDNLESNSWRLLRYAQGHLDLQKTRFID